MTFVIKLTNVFIYILHNVQNVQLFVTHVQHTLTIIKLLCSSALIEQFKITYSKYNTTDHKEWTYNSEKKHKCKCIQIEYVDVWLQVIRKVLYKLVHSSVRRKKLLSESLLFLCKHHEMWMWFSFYIHIDIAPDLQFCTLRTSL